MFKFIYRLFVFIIFIVAINIDSGGMIQGEGNHTFYLYSKSSQATIKAIPEKSADKFIYFKNALKGESVEFFSEEKALFLINKLNAKFVFSEKGEDFYCKYYYTDNIKDYVILNGEKINLHLSYGKGVFTVGTPIIFGSF